MAKKILDLSVLSSFLDNLKETFATLTHKHNVSDIEDYTVDSTFSAISENPIQNKVVSMAIDALAEGVAYIEYDEAATAALIDLLPKAEEVEF